MSRDDWSPPGGWQYLEDYLPEGRHGFSEQYHERVSKHEEPYEVCIVCGRRTTTDRGVRLILGSGGTGLVPPHLYEEAFASDSGFMGGFMVGPECGKKIPSEYHVT